MLLVAAALAGRAAAGQPAYDVDAPVDEVWKYVLAHEAKPTDDLPQTFALIQVAALPKSGIVKAARPNEIDLTPAPLYAGINEKVTIILSISKDKANDGRPIYFDPYGGEWLLERDLPEQVFSSYGNRPFFDRDRALKGSGAARSKFVGYAVATKVPPQLDPEAKVYWKIGKPQHSNKEQDLWPVGDSSKLKWEKVAAEQAAAIAGALQRPTAANASAIGAKVPAALSLPGELLAPER